MANKSDHHEFVISTWSSPIRIFCPAAWRMPAPGRLDRKRIPRAACSLAALTGPLFRLSCRARRQGNASGLLTISDTIGAHFTW